MLLLYFVYLSVFWCVFFFFSKTRHGEVMILFVGLVFICSQKDNDEFLFVCLLVGFTCSSLCLCLTD